MGNKKRQGKKGKGRNNSESENQNLEEKCSHVKDCVKITNLKNTIPHVDLSKCQDCPKLNKEPASVISEDTKSESVEEVGESQLDLTKNEVETAICICLRCANIACSRQSPHQHGIQHFKSNSNHPLVVNLANWVIWCYKCDNEVDVEASSVLEESLAFLKKALGIKAVKQDKRTEQSEKQKVSNIYSLSGKSATVKGLANLGNTCFFNSVMQNLCQSQLLRVAMNNLSDEFDYSILPAGDKEELGPISVKVTDKPGALTSALGKFLHDMSSEGKKQVISPGYLFSEICKKAPRFKGFRQQDSQELLRYLLDSVRTEEIKGVKRAILRSFGVKSVANDEGISADKVSEDVHEKIRVYGKSARAPIIDTLFGGHLVSSVECRTCHKVSTIMESFSDLSLSLATNNNNTSKQQNATPVTKKTQPPAPVAEKNTIKKTNKPAEPTPTQPAVTSKHKEKMKAKKKKKNKRKERKRLNSTSSCGRKKSETGEEDEVNDDDDDNDNPNDDVAETPDNDVTETPDNDVTETPDNDVTETPDNDVTETPDNDIDEPPDNDVDETPDNDVAETPDNDVTETSDNDVTETSVDVIKSSVSDDTETSVDDLTKISVEKNVTVMKNEFMHLAKVGNDERENCGAFTLSSEEEHSAAMKALNISKDEIKLDDSNIGDSTAKDDIEMAVLCQEKVAAKRHELVESDSNEKNNENGRTPGHTNGISSENEIRDEDVSGNGKVGRVDVLNDENNVDVLEHTGDKLQNCQNNKTCSLNIARENDPSICNGSTDHVDASGDKDHVSKSSLRTGEESLSNCAGENHEQSYATPTCHKVSSNGDVNFSSFANNKISCSCVVDVSEEHKRPKCETSNVTTEIKGVRVNSVGNESRDGTPDGITLENKEISVDKNAERTLQDTIAPDGDHDKSKPNHEIPMLFHELAEDSKTEKSDKNELSRLSPNNNRDNYEEAVSLAAAVNSETNTLLSDKLVDLALNDNTKKIKENEEDPSNFAPEDLSPNSNKMKSEIRNVPENVIAEHRTVPLPDEGIEKSKERTDVLAYVDRIVKDIIEICFQNISTKQPWDTDVETGNPVERKKVKEGFRNSAGNTSLRERECSKSKVDECQDALTSLSLDQSDYVKEYVERIVQNAINFCLARNSSTIRDNGPSEMEGVVGERNSKSGEIGNEQDESSVDPKVIESDDTETVSRSEILRGNYSLGNMEAIKSNANSVENCLKRFCSPEILDGSNMFICEQCNRPMDTEEENEANEDNTNEDNASDDKDSSTKNKAKRKTIYTEAVKQLLINQAPPILTLHLKRFHQVGYSLRKIGKHVDFPLVLDLAPFCHKLGKFATDGEGKVLYSLFGIVEHSGSLHSGHYTAYCRVPTGPSSLFETIKFEGLTQLLEVMDQMWTRGGKRESYVHEEPSGSRWFHISDSHVSEVGLERVLKAHAYLLFYERMVLSYGGANEGAER